MSFSSELKTEIATQSIKNSCCRRAFLNAILLSKAYIENDSIYFNIENDLFASATSKLITEFYGKVPEIQRPKQGGRCRTVIFKSKSAYKYLSNLENNASSFYAIKCESCSSVFLRGIFFSCGSISDPQKQYLLEFSPSSHHEIILNLLSDIGITPNVTVRFDKKVMYIKKSSLIEDFFAYSGMNNATFALMNAKIKRELRNNANRIANCEMNNIGKAVSASHRQISIIEELEKANLLSSLPEELEKTARLRLEKRDLSLSQLAAISVPSISKSGLSHRLNRIMELAAQLMPNINKLTE